MQDEVAPAPVRPATEDDPRTREGKGWLCCRVCARRIVRAAARISFDGDHTHRFTNPHGIRFDIALFDHASGCSHEGEPTEYFSWFPGYTWRIALCSSCRTHLGWLFGCVGPPGVGEPAAFHGLIAGRLRPES